MKVEIWSDIICPWCYIGKRRFETALAEFDGRERVETIWRSYELDPRAPQHYPGTLIERLAQKYRVSLKEAAVMTARVTAVAAEAGLHYRLEEARPGNTFNAHRLIHYAATHGLGLPVMERLMQGYFSEALPVGDPEALISVADEAGLDPKETRAVLAGDAHAAEVRADEERASHLGISGVPHFLFNEGFAISGAQPLEIFMAALRKAAG